MILSIPLFSQHIDTGFYNDFDFGPHGVYGNLKLEKPTAREFYDISKTSDSTITVKNINPSGVLLTKFQITFSNGTLRHLERSNQWGRIDEYRNYEMITDSTFKLTDLENGVNNFLPCKYAVETYHNELLVETSLHSNSGRLKENDRGYAIIRFKRYDDRIRFAERKEASYFDAENKPVISKELGYHTVKYTFDESDNKISESYFGILDQPVRNKRNNVFKEKYFYDAENHSIKNEFTGPHDQIMENAFGVAIVTTEYQNGYAVKVTRYDSMNRIARSTANGDGIAVIHWSIDKQGNIIKESYFNESGRPAKSYMGAFNLRFEYSPENMLTRRSYFDETGTSAENRDKIHAYVYVKDSLGKTIQESYFDMKGKPVKNFTDEVYMEKYKYDSFGRDISESYWQDSISPMARWNGIYEMQTIYNEDGQAIEYRYLDSNSQQLKSDEGYSVCRILLDENGLMYARQYLHNDELINKRGGMSSGFSIIRYEHDSVGRVNKILFYGNHHEALNATIDIDGPILANRVDFIYTGNRIIEQWYYSLNNDVPFLKLDCLKNNYLNPSGINMGHKNAN